MATTNKAAVTGRPLSKSSIASMALAILLSFMLALYGVPMYALASTTDAQDATVKTQSTDDEESDSKAKEASVKEAPANAAPAEEPSQAPKEEPVAASSIPVEETTTISAPEPVDTPAVEEPSDDATAAEVTESAEVAEEANTEETTDQEILLEAPAPARLSSPKIATEEKQSGSTSDELMDKAPSTGILFTVNNPSVGQLYHTSGDIKAIFETGVETNGNSKLTLSPSMKSGLGYEDDEYKFAYWFNMTTGTKYERYVSNNRSYAINPNISEGTYFVAVFVPKATYTITYSVEGGGTVSNYWDTTEDTVKGSTATPNDGYVFEGWYQGSNCVSTSSAIKPDKPSSDVTYTAKFRTKQQYNVSYSAFPQDFGTVTPEGETATEGESAHGSKASPSASNRYFSAWLDDAGNVVSYDSTFIPTAKQLEASTSYKAIFNIRAEYAIAISVNNNDYGYVSNKNYKSINGGNEDHLSNAYFEANGSLPYGLVATANSGYKFSHWLLNGHVIAEGKNTLSSTMAADYATKDLNTLIACFVPIEGGIVFYACGQGGIISNRSEVIGDSMVGSIATPNTGYKFDGWYDVSGSCVSSDATFSPNPGQGATYTAKFSPLETYTLTYKTDSPEEGSVSIASEEVIEGQPSQGVTATANEHYKFVGWYDESNNVVSKAANLVLESVGSNASYTAKFEMADYRIVYQLARNDWGSLTPSDGYEWVPRGGSAIGVTALDVEGSNPRYFVAWVDESGTVVSTQRKFVPSGSQLRNGAVYKAVYSNSQSGTILISVNNPSYGYVAGSESWASWGGNSKGHYVSAYFKDGGAGTLAYGLEAIPNGGYVFDHWSLNGNEVSDPSVTDPRKLSNVFTSGYQTTTGVNNLVAYFKPKDVEGSPAGFTFADTKNGYVTAFESNAAKPISYTAVPDEDYKFTGWYLMSSSDGGVTAEKLNLPSTFTAGNVNALAADQLKKIQDGATIKAVFVPENKGIVGYNMNLPGVDVKWSGASDIVMPTQKGAMMYYGAETYTSTTGDIKQFTVTDAVPQADGYVFVGWFDKDRTTSSKNLGIISGNEKAPETLRKAGDVVNFCYSGDTGDRYTLEALWLTIPDMELTVDYDGESHAVATEPTFVGGEIAQTDSGYKEQLDTVREDIKISGVMYKDNASGKEINTAEVTQQEPGTYEYTASGTIELKSLSRSTEFSARVMLTIKPKTVTVKKIWDDNGGVNKNRAPVTVDLLKNGTRIDQVVLTENKGWSHTFTNLTVADTYSIRETVIPVGYVDEPKYQSSNNGRYEEELKVTNSEKKINATVVKSWDDNDNQDGIRPENVTVRLLANGKPTDNVATLSAANEWSHEFTDLLEARDGNKIEYTVVEEEVSKGYTPSVNGMLITNIHVPETVDLSGTKTWDDAGDQDGIRPESVTLKLFADGDYLKDIIVRSDASGEWKWNEKGLPKYKEGEEIVYTITEDAVEGYEATITKTDEGFDIVNKHEPAPVVPEKPESPETPVPPVAPTTPDDPAPVDPKPEQPETPAPTDPKPADPAPSDNNATDDATGDDDGATDDSASTNTQRTRTQQATTQANRAANAATVAPAAAPAPAAAAEAVADDAAPLAAPEDEAIDDDANPLAGMDLDCWVHWWILLGIIITAAYTVVVTVRRKNNSHNMQKMDDNTMDPDDERRTADDSAPGFMRGPVVA